MCVQSVLHTVTLPLVYAHSGNTTHSVLLLPGWHKIPVGAIDSIRNHWNCDRIKPESRCEEINTQSILTFSCMNL